MPGKVADFLRAAELEPAERATLDQGITVRRGQGYTLRVIAVLAVHQRLLDLCQALDGTAALPAQRKARREYENRVNALPAAGPFGLTSALPPILRSPRPGASALTARAARGRRVLRGSRAAASAALNAGETPLAC